jgi:hypothetical protein
MPKDGLNESASDVIRRTTFKRKAVVERERGDDNALVNENIENAINSIHNAIDDLDAAMETVSVMSLSAELKRVPHDLKSKLVAVVRAAEKWQKQFSREA